MIPTDLTTTAALAGRARELIDEFGGDARYLPELAQAVAAALAVVYDAARAENELLRELAKRAVVALHLFERGGGSHRDDFETCRRGLCQDWHQLVVFADGNTG